MNGTIHVKDRAEADERVGTLEELMKNAEQGRLPKSVLVNLLDIQHRRAVTGRLRAYREEVHRGLHRDERPVPRIRMCGRRRGLSSTAVESRDRVSQGVRR